MQTLSLILAPLLLLSPAVTAVIRVDTDGSTFFDVLLDDVLLLSQYPGHPITAVGQGTFEAVYIEGNYAITDTVDTQIELDQFVVDTVSDGSDYNLTLTSSVDANVGLVLRLFESTPGDMDVVPDYFAFPNSGVNRFFLRISTAADEQIWGGGEQYTYLDLRRGPTYPIWVREQGVVRDPASPIYDPVSGGDYHTTYWPQPTFLSSRRYYFELKLPTYSELRLAPRGEDEFGHEIYWHRTPVPDVPCEDCSMRFVVRDTLLDIVKHVNPGAPLLPDWIYNGAIIGLQGGTDTMLQILDEADQYGARVSGLWIQDWSGKITTSFGTRVFWNWRWNETWYPDLDTVIQDLQAREFPVRVLVYLTGHLNIDGDVYQSAENEDYWLTTSDGGRLLQDFGEFFVSTVDLLEPDPSCNCVNPARDYYKNLMSTNALDLGISGWMADFGEYTPTDARTQFPRQWWGQQDQEEILHQVYSQEWAKLNRELLEETGRLGDTFFFMRSGGLKSKEYQQMSWAGDQTVDWSASDGLPSSIVAALSLACVGMGASHSDIGGYTGDPDLGLVRSKELLLRWAEYSTFTPVMRTHEGNRPEENHQVYSDVDTWCQFARLTNIYRTMSSYHQEAVADNSLNGIPAMRPLFLDFESDPGAYDDANQQQYLYGQDLLVAPVVAEGATDRQVYLPGPETWVWLWDASEIPIFAPTSISVPAPLGQTPVFYRYGSKWTDLFRTVVRQYAIDAPSSCGQQ